MTVVILDYALRRLSFGGMIASSWRMMVGAVSKHWTIYEPVGKKDSPHPKDAMEDSRRTT